MKGTFSNSKLGFTLVELVVVIAIIAILSGVGFAAYTGYVEYAQKGVDRQTVGEINHALELAYYSDPGLFSETGTVLFLTDSGLASLDPDVADALMDTFGDDLTSVRLTSDKWVAIDAEQLGRIADKIGADSGSYVRQYWDKNQTASFSGDITGLWEKVKKLMDARNAKASTPGERDEFLLKKAVEVSTGANAGDIKDIWVSPARIFETLRTDAANPGIATGDGSSAPLAVEVARSCAFVAYAERRDDVRNDETLSQELAEFKTSDAILGEPYLTSKLLADSKWDNIRAEYRTTQAEADALAYLGLMEVAKTVEDDIGADNATNDVFYGTITGYVGMTESMMSSEANWTAAKTLLRDSNTGVSATVTGTGSGVSIKWSDPDIDPRDSETAADPTYRPAAEDVTKSAVIDLKTGTLTATSKKEGAPSTGNRVVFSGPGQITIASAAGAVTLPDGYKVSSISCNGETQDFTDVSKTVSIGDFKVMLNGTTDAFAVILNVTGSSASSASTVLTFTLTLTDGSNSYPVDVPIELYNIG